MLEAAAAQSGRSLVQEVEHRIEQSFLIEAILDDHVRDELRRLLAA